MVTVAAGALNFVPKPEEFDQAHAPGPVSVAPDESEAMIAFPSGVHLTAVAACPIEVAGYAYRVPRPLDELKGHTLT